MVTPSAESGDTNPRGIGNQNFRITKIKFRIVDISKPFLPPCCQASIVSVRSMLELGATLLVVRITAVEADRTPMSDLVGAEWLVDASAEPARCSDAGAERLAA
jgi:hypothetical protein